MGVVLSGDKWKEPIEFVKFVVTGFYYNSNKRFRNVYDGTLQSYKQTTMINLWKGKVWGITEEGKRKLIRSVN